MLPPSKLSHGNDASPAHSWLEDKVYTPKRERTFELVQQSVDALLERKERVSLASIMLTSKEVDPEGRGISESAILGNDQARAYYEQHRTWKNSRKRLSSSTKVPFPSVSGSIKPDRDEQRARQRYLRMTKEALVDRLVVVERTYAQAHERWLSQQDDVLIWQLRAETAEARLVQAAETSTRTTHARTSSEKKG
jgi:hypothetical protein